MTPRTLVSNRSGNGLVIISLYIICVISLWISHNVWRRRLGQPRPHDVAWTNDDLSSVGAFVIQIHIKEITLEMRTHVITTTYLKIMHIQPKPHLPGDFGSKSHNLHVMLIEVMHTVYTRTRHWWSALFCDERVKYLMSMIRNIPWKLVEAYMKLYVYQWHNCLLSDSGLCLKLKTLIWKYYSFPHILLHYLL